MTKDLAYYMNLNYKIEIIPDNEEGGYTLHCPELPGCITCAETVEQGVALINDAKRAWLIASLDEGLPIAEPNTINDYNGQFEIRAV